MDHGLQTIKLYDFQEELVDMVIHNRFSIANTSRQAGKTTTAVVIILHYILFNSYKNVMLLSNKAPSARKILKRVKTAYQNLPLWIQQGVVEWNKGSVELENGSVVFAGSASSSGERGESANFVYIDETAFVEGWAEFYASTFPVITSGKTTKLFFTSTPKGLNHFHKFCVGAKEGRNGFKYLEVPWYKVPGRDKAWKEQTLGGINHDMQQWRQEFCCVTGDTMVTVRDKETGEIMEMNMSELYENTRKYEYTNQEYNEALNALAEGFISEDKVEAYAEHLYKKNNPSN